MIGFLKNLAPFLLYCASLALIARAILGKPELLFLFLTALIPLRNVIDRLHAYPLGKDIVDIALMVLVIGVIVKSLRGEGSLSSRSAITPIIGILVLYTFISVLQGSNYLGSYIIFDPSDVRVQSWKNFCMMPVLFFITLNVVKDKKMLWTTVLVICLTMTVIDFYVTRQISWYSSIASREKIEGTFVFLGPNEIAAFYNQYTVLLMGLYFFMRRSWAKLALFGLICINLFCILFLFSRAAYVALVIGLFFLFAIKKRIFLIPLILVLMCWQVALPEKVRDRILMTTDEYGHLDRSSEARLDVWQDSLDLFSESPIVGVGYGVFQHMGFGLGDTHNIYLKILAEQGIVGIFIFLLLLVIFFIQGIKLFTGGDDNLSKGLGLGFAMCIIVLMVNNIFGDRWTYLEVSSNLWIFAGLVARLNAGCIERSINKGEKQGTRSGK